MKSYIKLLLGAKIKQLVAVSVLLILTGTVACPAVLAFPQMRMSNKEAAGKRLNQTQSAKLGRLVEDYWEWYLADNPGFSTSIGDYRYNDRLYDISEKAYRRRYAAARRFLKQANGIREQKLTPQERITLKILRDNLTVAIEGEPLYAYRSDNYLLPLNQIEGFHLRLLGLPETHPFVSVNDYQTYLARLRGFPAQVDAAIANMRQGMKLGIVSPKPVVEAIIEQLQAGITTDAKKSPLYEPLERFPQKSSASVKAEITASLEREIVSTVTPAFRKLLNFVQTEYLPKAAPNFGFSNLPRGKEMFAYAVKVQTTTNLSPDEIYELGLKELEKIMLERQKLVKQLGFEGTPLEFSRQVQTNKALRLFDAAAVERTIRENLQSIEPRLPQLFANLPKYKYKLKPVEPFRAANFPEGALLSEDEGGNSVGVFYYNTYNMETEGVRKFLLPNLAFHEVLPGHLLQGSYANANNALPAFRRHFDHNAYNEGWATYAESLADELGAYPDPYARNFWLSAATFTYLSMVAEVGIQTKGWTREQTFAFMRKYLPIPEARLNDRLLRWSVMPAQGLGYGIGALRIYQLRAQAQRELGSRFDVRQFHNVVLNNGSMPLDVLSEVVEAWIAQTKAQIQE